jgi:lysophospholipase L1-like esterase
MPTAVSTISGAFLSGVDVLPVTPTKVLVTLGDSITDGDSNTRWPTRLAERLTVAKDTIGSVAVVNAGIGGNRLLRDGSGVSALARFDRDVLAVPGVTHVIVLEGINDIGWPGARVAGRQLADAADAPTAQEVIAGYQQLIARAHGRGLKVYGATLLPFAGNNTSRSGHYSGFYSLDKEHERETINAWIRTGAAFDGVVDFDAAMGDPQEPGKLSSAYDSGDNLHPGAVGYKAMADAIPLTVFKSTSPLDSAAVPDGRHDETH